MGGVLGAAFVILVCIGGHGLFQGLFCGGGGGGDGGGVEGGGGEGLEGGELCGREARPSETPGLRVGVAYAVCGEVLGGVGGWFRCGGGLEAEECGGGGGIRLPAGGACGGEEGGVCGVVFLLLMTEGEVYEDGLAGEGAAEDGAAVLGIHGAGDGACGGGAEAGEGV